MGHRLIIVTNFNTYRWLVIDKSNFNTDQLFNDDGTHAPEKVTGVVKLTKPENNVYFNVYFSILQDYSLSNPNELYLFFQIKLDPVPPWLSIECRYNIL